MPETQGAEPDTGYYLYAVVPASGPPALDVTGIDDTDVDFVEYADIAAAVGLVALDRPRGRRHDLLAHSRVIEALASQCAVVPVQFGSIMPDIASVQEDLLAAQGQHFSELLERLEGTAQFNLRATYNQEQVLTEVVRDNPAIAELHRRTRDLPEGAVHPDLIRLGEQVSQALDLKRAADTDLILESVTPLVLALRERPGTGVDHAFDVAVLVEQSRREEFEESLEVLAEAVHERVRLSLTGPLPAYDFVEDTSWA
jgi:hypothetical protein